MNLPDKDIVDRIELLKLYTTDNIKEISKGLIPEFIDTKWKVVDSYVYDSERIHNLDRNQVWIRLQDLRFTVENDRKDLSIFIQNAEEAVSKYKSINPFVFFINNIQIKLSRITIVRELKYTYFLINDAYAFRDNIESIDMIHIPFNTHYTEERKWDQDNEMVIFRFNDDGLTAPWGKVVYSTPLKDLIYTTDTLSTDQSYVNIDLPKVDADYKVYQDNFIFFKDRKLCKDIKIELNNLNMYTINEGTPMETDVQMIMFYRNVINKNISNIIIPDNRNYIKRIITGDTINENIDTNRLNIDFNFKYNKEDGYERNLKRGIRYIHQYRESLVNPIYEERSIIRTLTYTGKEIKEKLDSKSNLNFLRWKYKELDTFVIVYKNNELYDRYHNARYEANKIIIPVLDEVDDQDIFEFVFFRFVNNYICSYTVKEEDNWISCIPFTTDELQITSDFIPDNFYGLDPTENTQYKLKYTIEKINEEKFIIKLDNPAYYEAPSEEYVEKNEVSLKPIVDPAVKLTVNGEELSSIKNIERDSTVRLQATLNDSIEEARIEIETAPFEEDYLGKTLTFSSLKQFRYAYYPINVNTCMFTLPHDFRTCLNPNNYIVYANGRMLTRNMWRLLLPDKYNSFLEPCIHSRVMLLPGERFEVFYLPIELNVMGIGEETQTDIVDVIATQDKQPIFTIPFPSDNFLGKKNSFIVILGTLIVDPQRYNVIGNKLTFIDPNDYVDKGRKLTFIFFYTKSNYENSLYIDEENCLIVDAQYVMANSNNQRDFKIPWPSDERFTKGRDMFFVTYRGMYVTENRYSVDIQQDLLHFNNSNDYIENGSALIFVFIYSQNNTTIKEVKTSVEATEEDQTVFSIPVPTETYLANHNTFYLTLNGIFLRENEDYIVDTNLAQVTLTTDTGCSIGEELVFTFFYGEEIAVKCRDFKVLATKEEQTEFDLPATFADFTSPRNKMFLIAGTLLLDPRAYSISENKIYLLNSFDALPPKAYLTLKVIYQCDLSTINIDENDGSSDKETNFNTYAVNIDSTGKTTYTLPVENALIFNKKFFITIGSTFIPDTCYTKKALDNTITFTNPDTITQLIKNRTILFTFIENDYLVIEHEYAYVEATADGQMSIDIPLPFDNFIEQGNKVLVFRHTTFISPERYTINGNTLTFIDDDDALDKGIEMMFMFIYVANQSNSSLERDDVSAAKIREYGYIYIPKNKTNYAMDKKLYFLYLNGKKIDLPSIRDIACNIIRLTRDPQSRYNVTIYDYTPQIPDFKEYNKILSVWDEIMNKMLYEELNVLFELYNQVSDTEPRIIPDITQEALIKDIVLYHYVTNGISEALPFIYTYENKVFKEVDEYGNLIIRAMDASDQNMPDYDHYIND